MGGAGGEGRGGGKDRSKGGRMPVALVRKGSQGNVSLNITAYKAYKACTAHRHLRCQPTCSTNPLALSTGQKPIKGDYLEISLLHNIS